MNPIQTTAYHTLRQALTPWELPKLLMPTYHFRRTVPKRAKERSHYAAILAYIHRNRFVIASQVRRRFSDRLRSDRTTRRHLAEMQALGYLGLAPTRSTSPLFPKVYYATGRGIRKLKQTLAAQGKPWQPPRVDRKGRHTREGYSSDRVVHEVQATEFLLAVWQTIQQRDDLKLLTIQRRSLAKHPAFVISIAERTTRLEPDALFVFRQDGSGMIGCFLEVDRGTMNRTQLQRKLRRYALWSQSESGQRYLIDLYRQHGSADPKPNFRLLFVAGDRTNDGGLSRLIDLYVVALGTASGVRDRLWLTTVGDLCRHQRDFQPLGATIWHRVRDAQPWHQEMHATAIAGGQPARRWPEAIRKVVEERLKQSPLHAVFPPLLTSQH